MKYTGICIGGVGDGQAHTCESEWLYVPNLEMLVVDEPVSAIPSPARHHDDVYRFVAFWFNGPNFTADAVRGYWVVQNEETRNAGEAAEMRLWVLDQMTKRYTEDKPALLDRLRKFR